ncbi:MAG: hypothetical protein HC911_17560 [Chloroflexaceae bacterium]|nr:hypothetical protein [Chloroflexaceae bacterium]
MNEEQAILRSSHIRRELQEKFDAITTLLLQAKGLFEEQQLIRIRHEHSVPVQAVYAALYPDPLVQAAYERYTALLVFLAVVQTTQATVDAAMGLDTASEE